MWIIAAITIWLPEPMGYMQLPESHPIIEMQVPSATEEACHIQAIDNILANWNKNGMMDTYREKGFWPFVNVGCEQVT